MSDRKPTTTMTWTDWRGKEQSRQINHTIDIRDYLGTPGYSALFVAANTHLSAPDLWEFLDAESLETPFVGRSLSWIKRRRWLFQQPGTSNLGRADKDGRRGRAIAIMGDNPTLSVRKLTALLKERGIFREREWVRKNRCARE